MLAIEELDARERSTLYSLPHGLTFERRLFQWAREVDHLERDQGYLGCELDFDHALWIRDLLEVTIVSATSSLLTKLRGATDPLDRRFRVATTEDSGPDWSEHRYAREPPYPRAPPTWEYGCLFCEVPRGLNGWAGERCPADCAVDRLSRTESEASRAIGQ